MHVDGVRFRFKNIDPDTGIERRMSFSDAPKDVYPISITPENQHGIQGSCAVLKERTDVTQHVRSKSLAPLLDLPEALERFVETCSKDTLHLTPSDPPPLYSTDTAVSLSSWRPRCCDSEP